MSSTRSFGGGGALKGAWKNELLFWGPETGGKCRSENSIRMEFVCVSAAIISISPPPAAAAFFAEV